MGRAKLVSGEKTPPLIQAASFTCFLEVFSLWNTLQIISQIWITHRTVNNSAQQPPLSSTRSCPWNILKEAKEKHKCFRLSNLTGCGASFRTLTNWTLRRHTFIHSLWIFVQQTAMRAQVHTHIPILKLTCWFSHWPRTHGTGQVFKACKKIQNTIKQTHQIKWDFIALSVQSEELRFTDAASANDFCCVHLYLRIHISRWHFHPRSSSIKVFCVVLDVVVDKRRNEKIAVIVTLEKNSRKEISKHTFCDKAIVLHSLLGKLMSLRF